MVRQKYRNWVKNPIPEYILLLILSWSPFVFIIIIIIIIIICLDTFWNILKIYYSMKGVEFVVQLSDCQLLKRYCHHEVS
jgi:hypothetical protein